MRDSSSLEPERPGSVTQGQLLDLVGAFSPGGEILRGVVYVWLLPPFCLYRVRVLFSPVSLQERSALAPVFGT